MEDPVWEMSMLWPSTTITMAFPPQVRAANPWLVLWDHFSPT
jgi:hypothetical protein